MTSGHLSEIAIQRLVDGEAPAEVLARWTAHVAECEGCRRRHAERTRLGLQATDALRTGDVSSAADHARKREVLAQQIHIARRSLDASIGSSRKLASALARWSTVAAAVVAVLLTARMLRSRPKPEAARAHTAGIERDALPISSLTPGATEDVSIDQLCGSPRRGSAPADPSLREGILRDYGMSQVPEHEYELDYLITPELGGANDRRNLWPERYTDRTWNAKVKDQLEDLLPALVCQGKVDLRTAQQDIAANWVTAYKKYFKTDTPLER